MKKSIEIQAPNRPIIKGDMVSVFLAGSIEMGSAEPWQDEMVKMFPHDVLFYNPRRADWDSNWFESSDQFKEQVNWELDMLDNADIILMYFDPNTKSPISLLELGLFADSGKLFVCCPDGFWRKGNVKIVCERFDVPLFDTKEEWLKALPREFEGEYWWS
jgi:hypothetical protein